MELLLLRGFQELRYWPIVARGNSKYMYNTCRFTSLACQPYAKAGILNIACAQATCLRPNQNRMSSQSKAHNDKFIYIAKYRMERETLFHNFDMSERVSISASQG